MNVLIIGGSRFIGPLIIEELLRRNHDVTVFNRGLIRQEYPEGVRFIKGDRNYGFSLYEHFDTIVDTCAYRREDTLQVIKELRFDFLVHLSTATVYKKSEIFPLTENSPLGGWPFWGEYNRGKVECEKILEESGVPYASIRPVYILGPQNYIEREKFIYSRLLADKPLLLPGDGRAVIQFVHVRDIAEALVALAEKKPEGAFNCASDETITLKDLVEQMARIAGRSPIIKYNPSADGKNFNADEFPFANENMVVSNEKIKGLGIEFAPLIDVLRNDYKRYWQHAF